MSISEIVAFTVLLIWILDIFHKVYEIRDQQKQIKDKLEHIEDMLSELTKKNKE